MKKLLLLSLGLLLMACSFRSPEAGSGAASSTDVALPNIVIFFTDDQGYQDLGCFGSPDIKTPHIDQMAKEGVKFTNFYVGQAVCSASRAALMTGCYPSRVDVMGAYMPNSKKGLNPNETTIAELLKPLGYATGIFGKWHLGDRPGMMPNDQGFDEYYGIPYSNDMWPLHPWQGTIFDFPPLPLYENEQVIDTLDDQSLLTTWITERAVKFIDQHRDQPFFAYIPHPQPHVPLFVSGKFKGKSERGLYGDVISEIDWSVGQVLDALRKNGLDSNTLVIFTSDNGPWLSYGTHSGSALPLREGKGTSLEGGIRVPCVMRWPGKIPAGKVVENPAMTIDILPTIAGLTGARLPANKIDGKNMFALMQGKTDAPPHHEAYYIYYKQNELQAILSGDGRWKLYFPHTYRSLNGKKGRDDGMPIQYTNDNQMGLELYDLNNDISETKNVAGQHPEIVEQLKAYAEKARREMGDQLTGQEGAEVRKAGEVGS